MGNILTAPALIAGLSTWLGVLITFNLFQRPFLIGYSYAGEIGGVVAGIFMILLIPHDYPITSALLIGFASPIGLGVAYKVHVPVQRFITRRQAEKFKREMK